MEWTDEHDVLMLREMIVSDLFSFKKGSVGRGDAWDFIAEKLNQIDSPQFRIKVKRGVRGRWVLLRRKFKSKIREEPEEAASGVVVEDLTEKEVLIEELIEREDTIKPDDNRLSVQQDKNKAEDIRKKAMESMGETKKRKLSRGTTDEDHQPTTSGRKRCAQPLVDFLHENANAERELHQQELDIK